MLRSILKEMFLKRQNLLPRQFYCTDTSAKESSKSSKKVLVKSNVPGLSDKCVKIPSTPVGPGASKDKEYKNPEYFCYHVDSFGEAEVELANFRLPPPSNKVPFQR